jgi:hypothetical protein
MICSGFVAVALGHLSGLPDLRGGLRPLGGQICDGLVKFRGNGNGETGPDPISLP